MLSFVLAVLSAGPPSPVPFDAMPYRALVEQERKRFEVPGAAVVIVKQGKVVFLEGFGVRELGRPAPVTPDTVFPIASCSKAFATTLLAMHVAEGKLAWNDKVRKHLDWFRLSDELADREVTVRDLITHQTGMPRHDLLRFLHDNDDQEAVIRQWMKARPAHSFREKYDYSNVPFTTAGLIAGRLSGTSWGEATRDRIFRPLGMNSSTCFGREAERAADRMTPHYRPRGGSVTALPWFSNDNSGAAGCVHSTARDLACWLAFQLADGSHEGRPLLPSALLRQTREPAVVRGYTGGRPIEYPAAHFRHHSYALGWAACDYRGATLHHHSGGRPGLRTLCLLLPEHQVGVFILSNMQGVAFCEAVGHGMLDLLLNLPSANWGDHYAGVLKKARATESEALKKRQAERQKDTRPSLPLARYAGTYTEPAYGTLVVRVEGKELRARLGQLEWRLVYHHFDTFTARLHQPRIQAQAMYSAPTEALFRLSPRGEVETLILVGQPFRRAKPK